MLYWFWTQPEGIIVPDFPDRLIAKAGELVRYTKELEEKIGVRDLRDALALEEEIRSSYAIEGEKLDSCRLRSSIAKNMQLSSQDRSYPSQNQSLVEDRAVVATLAFLEERKPLSGTTEKRKGIRYTLWSQHASETCSWFRNRRYDRSYCHKREKERSI